MPLRRMEGTMDVLTAARLRIKNAFANGCKIYLSFSSGKDSLCMSSITYDLILSGEINPKQLIVVFIDEEGLYTSMVEAALYWRKKFLSVGAQFHWFCLPFRQVSVLDHLSVSESWITWEPGKEDVWMRQPPPFAVMHSPYLEYPGQMNYQAFCRIAFADGIQMVGLRTSESLTRLNAISQMDTTRVGACFYPIYDWKDTDVWLYIKERNLPFPEIYMRLYEAGVQKNHLDSDMFRRSSNTRRALAAEEAPNDYTALVEDVLFINTASYTIPADTFKLLRHWRTLYKKTYGIAKNHHYKRMYEAILYGDRKSRGLRIQWNVIFRDYKDSFDEDAQKGGVVNG